MANKNKIINIYLICSFTGIILFFIFLFFNSNLSTWLVMEHNFKYQFSDFFRQIVYSSDLANIYFNTTDAPFPPFAYCFFHLIYLLNPVNYKVQFDQQYLCASNKYNLLILLVIFGIFMLAFYYIINKFLKKNKDYKNILLTISLLLSAPFLAGALERGNTIFFVLVFLLYALYLKDCKSKILKEIALILIAVSAGFKIYPAIFGLLYIKEKRYKEFLRLVLYCSICLFVPYLFTGGIQGMIHHFSVVISFQESEAYRFTSIRCFFLKIIDSFNLPHLNIFVTVGKIIENIFLVIFLIMIFKTKKKWKTLFYISAIMSIYVSNSYRYTSVYMVIPLLFLLKDILEDKKITKLTYVYIILFALIYTIPVYAFSFDIELFIFLPIYILIIISIVEDTILERRN